MDRKALFTKLSHHLLPNAGTIVIVLALLWAQQAGALGFLASESTSTTTISYQGRLADSGGTPITNTLGMTFRIYNVATGGSPLWTETYPAVQISDGLFHVLLGSVMPLPESLFTQNDTLYLGLTVGADGEMTPREQLASAPYAMQAGQALTVADGSITTAKLVDGAVTQSKLASDIILGFGGRPSSYPYILHMAYFGLNNGNFCSGSAPGDPGCDITLLIAHVKGLKVYAPSGRGYISAANNSGYSPSAKWGYAYSFFLNNAGAAKPLQLPLHSCNDVAIYVTTGSVGPEDIGGSITQAYHRYPGSSNPGLNTCDCQIINPTIQIPTGAFRLSFLTRGKECTSYIELGSTSSNWIQAANLAIDWPNMRLFLGEQ